MKMRPRTSNRASKAQALADGHKLLNSPLARVYENAADVFERLRSESAKRSQQQDAELKAREKPNVSESHQA